MKKLLLIATLAIHLVAATSDDGIAAYENNDYAKAYEIFNQLCENGNSSGCNNLGILYRNGKGVEKDIQKAENLYSKSCRMNDQTGCRNLLQLVKIECDENKNAAYCYKFADIYHHHWKKEKEPQFYQTYINYLGKACTNGYEKACIESLAQMKQQGKKIQDKVEELSNIKLHIKEQ